MNDNSPDPAVVESVAMAPLGTRIVAYMLDLVLVIFLSAFLFQFVIFPQMDAQIRDEYFATAEAFIQKAQTGTLTEADMTAFEGNESLAMVGSYCIAFMLFCNWAYFVICERWLRSSSLGKLTFSIRVASASSSLKPGFSDILMRSGIKTISFLGLMMFLFMLLFGQLLIHPILLLLGDYIVAFFRKDRRCIHDLLSRTWVVVPTQKRLLDEIT